MKNTGIETAITLRPQRDTIYVRLGLGTMGMGELSEQTPMEAGSTTVEVKES